MAKITEELIQREHGVHEYIEKHADLFDLDPNLIRGLITQESRFIAEAVSPTGAYGYGQFTGIGARQVVNISAMTEKAADLKDFVKSHADQPDRGIKAICATLWWLFNKKYAKVADRKVQLEAVLTFYNSGGRPAALVIKHGGHAQALSAINALPGNIRSQSAKYAPQLSAWFVAWHEHFATRVASVPPAEVNESSANPFDEFAGHMTPAYKALIEALLLLSDKDPSVDSIVSSRDGLTELTLIFPGEIN